MNDADKLHRAVMEFIARGRRAQEAVDRILAAQPERRRSTRARPRKVQ
jgi:hypothetical protein